MSSYAGQVICQRIYTNTSIPSTTSFKTSFYAYRHSEKVTSTEICNTGSSAISGIAFNDNANNYPAVYDNALYFADSSRRCIWAVLADPATGNPVYSNRVALVQNDNTSGSNPGPRVVDLQSGPGGNLYYLDLEGGRVVRLDYFTGNQPPTAVISAVPTNGAAPLLVQFSASGSSDPEDGSNLAYAWDLDGDGAYDDSADLAPSWTYTAPGNVTVRLQVTDSGNSSATTSVVISAGNTAPVAQITTPTTAVTWTVGQPISFAGSATDTQQGTLPAGALNWQVLMHHCYSATDCHTHSMAMFFGVASGTFVAPDHEYPSRLEFILTATDAGGLSSTSSIIIDPVPVNVSLSSVPTGLNLTIGAETRAAPFTRTVTVGSNNQVTAPSPQTLGGVPYAFLGWSDGLAQTHPFTAPASPLSLTATYQRAPQVSITSPANGARIRAGTQTISASATDADGSVTQVRFYVDNVLLATDTAAPWQASWNATVGTRVLKAVATDNLGATTTSSSNAVRVKRR
jgi:PKD repeat protein